MDGAQGAHPGEGMSNCGDRRADSFEGQEMPKTALERMLATMNALSEALKAGQNKETPTERKEVCLEDDDEVAVFFSNMTVEMNPEPTQPHDNGLDETQRQYSAMLEAVREMEQEKLSAYEARKVDEAITAQVIKDTEERAMKEEEEETQAVRAHRKADDALKAEADLLYQATRALQRARGESSPGNGSAPTWDSPPEGWRRGVTQGSFVVHSPGDIHGGGDPSPDELTTRPTQTKSTEELDSDTLQDDADHEYARTMADPFMREQITRSCRPLDNWPHEATLEKMTDEEVRRLGILNLEANMREVRENLANLEEMRRELDDHKPTETEANQGVSEDDDDLDTFSDSVEKWDLKDG
jgi:hypothetical protein